MQDDYDFVPSRRLELESPLLQTACKIISQADREHPADSLLRETFKRLRVFNADETRAISNTVFTYFRWRGFLDALDETRAQVEQAFSLAEQFEQDPFSLTDDDLRAKTVPNWAAAEVETTADWFRALQRPPNLWLRAKRGQGNRLSHKLNAELRLLPDALVYTGKEDLFRTPEFHAGEFELQDINSQAVGFVCAPQPGETWWDACSGEGGKLMHLSDLMENKGLIWASDRAEWRLKHLKRRAARAKAFNYRAAPWNGGTKLPTKTKFHGVLLDAPCSGVGTWQRNPHARWTTTIEDVKELAEVQKQLLANAAGSLKPGGKLIYSVCTLTKSETLDVAAAFEKQFSDFKPLPVSNPLDPQAPASPQLWLWPQQTGGNGMFIAAWKKE